MVNKIVELDDNKNYVLLDETVLNGVKYYLTSCDLVGNELIEII